MEIIYLKNKGFSYYQQAKAKIIKMDFDYDQVDDMEVLQPEKLAEVIGNFIETNKLLPATLTIVLSPSVLFEKILTDFDGINLSQTEKSFLDNVPFENVTVKHYRTTKGYRIMAVNAEFYHTIINAFKNRGYIIKLIIPEFLIDDTNKRKDIDLPYAQYIIKRFSTFNNPTYSVNKKEIGNSVPKKQKSVFLPVLIPFLILLTGIFVFIVFYTYYR